MDCAICTSLPQICSSKESVLQLDIPDEYTPCREVLDPCREDSLAERQDSDTPVYRTRTVPAASNGVSNSIQGDANPSSRTPWQSGSMLKQKTVPPAVSDAELLHAFLGNTSKAPSLPDEEEHEMTASTETPAASPSSRHSFSSTGNPVLQANAQSLRAKEQPSPKSDNNLCSIQNLNFVDSSEVADDGDIGEIDPLDGCSSGWWWRGCIDTSTVTSSSMSGVFKNDVQKATLSSAASNLMVEEPIHNRAHQYNWIFALAMPNSDLSTSVDEAISWTQAKSIYMQCFKGEECFDAGSSIQDVRFRKELEIFKEAFNRLPYASSSSEKDIRKQHTLSLKTQTDIRTYKVYRGRGKPEPEPSDGSGQGSRLPKNFLELMRNVVITKLTVHCNLMTRLCYSEDGQHDIALITCRESDLLEEADREELSLELDIRRADPISLEPCTPTYYPLLQWFFRYSNLGVKACEGLVDAYEAVLRMLKALTREEQHAHTREIEFWMDVREAAAVEHHPEVKALPKHSQKGFPPGKHNLDAKDHLFGASERALAKAFKEYMELKAGSGIHVHPVKLIEETNFNLAKKKSKVQLYNLFGRVGCPEPVAPFRTFDVKDYGDTDKHWMHWWKHHPTRMRQRDLCLDVLFKPNQRIRLLKSVIDRQIDLEKLIHLGAASAFFPLDTREKVESIAYNSQQEVVTQPTRLSQAWALPESAGVCQQAISFVKTLSVQQPIDEIRDYFGPRIAFYFALVQLLSQWVMLPAVVGILTFAIRNLQESSGTSRDLRMVFDIAYSAMMVVWSTLVLEIWKRQQHEWAVRWGMTSVESHDPQRPEFYGSHRRSPVDFREDLYFPKVYSHGVVGRIPRRIVSYILLLSLAILEVNIILGVLHMRGELSKGHLDDANVFRSVTFAMSSIMSCVMGIFGGLGNQLAQSLNKWENHKTSHAFVNNLISKVFVFEFVGRYSIFMYVAFLKARVEGCVVLDNEGHTIHIPASDDTDVMCQTELEIVVRTVFFSKLLMNVVEVLAPLAKSWYRRRQIMHTNGTQEKLSVFIPSSEADDSKEGYITHGGSKVQAWDTRMSYIVQEHMDKEPYGGLEVDGSFEDFSEIASFFGYVALFSLAFPLAPLLTFILLVTEMRVDGFKLFTSVRRPLPYSAANIGNWYLVLDLISAISIATNAGLLVYTYGHFDQFSSVSRELCFSVILLILLGSKFMVSGLIPDLPEHMRIIEARHQSVIDDLTDSHQSSFKNRSRGLGDIDLQIDDANSGQFRDPLDFAVSRLSVRKRVKTMQTRARIK